MIDDRIKMIREYEDRIRLLSESDENERRRAMWLDDPSANDFIWHPRPKQKGVVPFTFEMERVCYSQILEFSLVRFYTDPIEYILRSLQMSLYLFENFHDCTPIGKSVTYWPGVGFEVSLFGMPQVITEHDAWVGREHTLKERVPISALERPDFYKHEEMKNTIDFYSRMREVLSEDFYLAFPQWCRSSWGVAWQLRGIENLLIDYIEDPDWLIDFLDFLSDCRIEWSTERAKLLGVEQKHANLFNDEVTTPIVSPALYDEFIRPSEEKISAFFGGINYWHSCGDTTQLIPYINKVPGVEMVHISPWTDLDAAVEQYDQDKTLERVLHPHRDVISPESEGFLRAQIQAAKDAGQIRSVTLRADGFEIINGMDEDLQRMKHWVNTANEILIK